MDIEQLKLILETVNAVGGDAKSVFFWWLATHLAQSAMVLAGFCSLVYVAYRLIRPLTHDAIALREIGRAAGYDCRGEWLAFDTRQTVDRINDLKRRAGERGGAA